MTEIPKKIKVRVSNKVGAIYQDGRKFLPGDIIEIPESGFRPDHYEKILPPAPKPAPEETEISEKLREEIGEKPPVKIVFPRDEQQEEPVPDKPKPEPKPEKKDKPKK